MEPVPGSPGIAVQNQFRDCLPPFCVPRLLRQTGRRHLDRLPRKLGGFVEKDSDELIAQHFFAPFRIVQPCHKDLGTVFETDGKFTFRERIKLRRNEADEIFFQRIAPEGCFGVGAALAGGKLSGVGILQRPPDQIFCDECGFSRP